MSKKPSNPPSSPRKKATAPKTSTKKSAADKPMHGKVTEPLVAPKKPQSSKGGKTNSSNADKGGMAKLKFWQKEKETSGAYTSVKHRNHKGTVGASTRASAESDLIRFQLIWLFASLFLMGLVGRALYLQLINSQKFIDKGNEIITSERTQHSYRGMITDRNNQPLAVSAPLSSVSLVLMTMRRLTMTCRSALRKIQMTRKHSKDCLRN